jgi:hypothetical protein
MHREFWPIASPLIIVDMPASVARMSRMVWIAAAVAWAISSGLMLAGAYWAPSSVLDWAAVLAYAAAWLLLAPGVFLATRLVPSRAARVLGGAIAIGSVVAGIANLLASVTSMDGVTAWYADGILLATILLVPLSYLFARDRSNQLAIFALLLFVGLGFTAGGISGLLVALAFGALAYRTAWFHPRPRPVLAEAVAEVRPA